MRAPCTHTAVPQCLRGLSFHTLPAHDSAPVAPCSARWTISPKHLQLTGQLTSQLCTPEIYSGVTAVGHIHNLHLTDCSQLLTARRPRTSSRSPSSRTSVWHSAAACQPHNQQPVIVDNSGRHLDTSKVHKFGVVFCATTQLAYVCLPISV